MSEVQMLAGSDSLERARLLLAARHYQDAATLAYQCAGLRPGDPWPLIIAAWAEVGLERRREAKKAAEAAVAVAPGLPEAHQALVAALTARAFAAGRYSTGRAGRRAVAAAKRLVRLAPTEVYSQWALIEAAVAAHRPRLAVAASNTALEMAPHLSRTWVLRAGAARSAGDLQVAESAVREALRLDPGNYSANTELGVIALLRGRKGEALQQLNSTATLDPIARPARAALLSYGAIQFQVLIQVLTLPVWLLTHSAAVWVLGSVAINAAIWRFGPTRRRLEHGALSIALRRSRRPTRPSRRKESLVPPSTPIQCYRSSRIVLLLSLILLIMMSVLATGGLAQKAPEYVPLSLLIDVPTCAFAWFVCKRYMPRPALRQ